MVLRSLGSLRRKLPRSRSNDGCGQAAMMGRRGIRLRSPNTGRSKTLYAAGCSDRIVRQFLSPYTDS